MKKGTHFVGQKPHSQNTFNFPWYLSSSFSLVLGLNSKSQDSSFSLISELACGEMEHRLFNLETGSNASFLFGNRKHIWRYLYIYNLFNVLNCMERWSIAFSIWKLEASFYLQSTLIVLINWYSLIVFNWLC